MSEWPKPWDEIRNSNLNTDLDTDGYLTGLQTETWADFGPLRTYQGCIYINSDGGHETESNGDLWLPLGVYLEN